jgi:hypothetical protein
MAILSTHPIDNPPPPTVIIARSAFGVLVAKSPHPNEITVEFNDDLGIEGCTLKSPFFGPFDTKPAKSPGFLEINTITKGNTAAISFQTSSSSESGFYCLIKDDSRATSFTTRDTGIAFLSSFVHFQKGELKTADRGDTDTVKRYDGPVRVRFAFPTGVTDFKITGGIRPHDAQEGVHLVELPQDETATVEAEWTDIPERDLRDLIIFLAGTVLGLGAAAFLEFIKYYAERRKDKPS